jgi:hypothetical protein
MKLIESDVTEFRFRVSGQTFDRVMNYACGQVRDQAWRKVSGQIRGKVAVRVCIRVRDPSWTQLWDQTR